jgi:hypothetical protein
VTNKRLSVCWGGTRRGNFNDRQTFFFYETCGEKEKQLLSVKKMSLYFRHVAGSTSLAVMQTSCTSNVSHCLQQKICSYISIEDSGVPGCDAVLLGKYFPVFELKQHLLHCRMVLGVALVYLSCIHLHRQMYDYGSYTLDITGMLCVDVILCCIHAPGSTLSHLYFFSYTLVFTVGLCHLFVWRFLVGSLKVQICVA